MPTKRIPKKEVKNKRTISSVRRKAVSENAAPVKKPAVTKKRTQTTAVIPKKKTESSDLPKSLFQVEVKNAVLTQAVRMYLANQRFGQASTKTRGQVEGSTRKVYKQKGTGRARHGSIRAPIYVGGGIVFGPKTRDYSMKMPQSMRHAAIRMALSVKYSEGNIIVTDKFEKMEPKTKVMASYLKQLAGDGKMLIVCGDMKQEYIRGLRNINRVTLLQASSLNTYEILSHKKIIIEKKALPVLETVFAK